MTNHITNYLKHLFKPEEDWKLLLLTNWPSIMGNLANKVTLERITHDTIIIGVFDSCWMQELYLLSPLILTLINKSLDQPHIKQIRLKQTTIKQDTSQKKILLSTLEQQVSLNADDIKALEVIRDRELFEILQAFRLRCYREQKKVK